MTPAVRFAPSPTGQLHIGNIRTATLNWLFARKHGGTFLLRLDDTDRARSTEELADGIRTDLTWLGLNWDREEQQSLRTECYDRAADALKAKGLLYACYESEDELDRRRKRLQAMHKPPIYDRAGLKLTAAEHAAHAAAGRMPHWRFRLPNTTNPDALLPEHIAVTWDDLVRGPQTVDLGSLSDPVLIRADGTYLYTFTSVVDDIEFAITHIIRGEDHVTNTGVQLALFDALGGARPLFGHHSLLVGADGQALSKRLGALSVESFRDAGLEPMAVLSHAALVGTSDAIEPYAERDDLAKLLDFNKISTAPGRFDIEELQALNAKLLHDLPYDDVAQRLTALGITGGAPFWLAVRGNLMVLKDALPWWRVVSEPLQPVVENAAFNAEAANVLPAEPWTEDTWGQWTSAIKAKTGAKGRALFHPLRLALTAVESGPELKALLPLIGRQRALDRLAGKVG
ncbi:MAG: glutamate--tRNA ligase [Hyphomicrobium sp.]